MQQHGHLPRQTYIRQLPLELNVAIAKELGDDVFRLRHERLPVDLSSDLVLYNAIVDYESHEAGCSIRKPLKELGKHEQIDIRQEMKEREALYWSHQRGCPRKLIASGDVVHDDDGNAYCPALWHGYLIYMGNDFNGPVCVIRDLMRRKQWFVRHRNIRVVTVTETTLAIAVGIPDAELLVGIDLKYLEESGDIDLAKDEWSTCRIPGNVIVDQIVGRGNTFLLRCEGADRTLRLWKDGSCRLLTKCDIEDECSRVLGVEASAFVHAYFVDAYELWVERYSFGGEPLSRIHIALDDIKTFSSLNLRHTGSTWLVAMDDIESLELGGHRRNLTLARPLTETGRFGLWKGMKYEVIGDNIRISRVDEDDWRRNTRPIGDLRFVSTDLESSVLDLIVDDSFLVLLQKSRRGLRWFVFTFEDLPGMKVSKEPVVDQYYWLPRDDDAIQRQSRWTWQGS